MLLFLYSIIHLPSLLSNGHFAKYKELISYHLLQVTVPLPFSSIVNHLS